MIAVEWIDFGMLKELMQEEPLSLESANDVLKNSKGNEVGDNEQLQELIWRNRPVIKEIEDEEDSDAGDDGVISLELVSNMRTTP